MTKNKTASTLRMSMRAFATAVCRFMVLGALAAPCFASCPAPTAIGASPTRLMVIAPATAQSAEHWASFLAALKKDPRAQDIAWLVFDHGIQFTSLGSAYDVSSALDACIAEKANDERYKSITLVGHSIGGMLMRRAYLNASGATVDAAQSPSWAGKVDRILLFTSVNRGIPRNVRWWSPAANWLLRTLPHPQLMLEDMALGSDFIADVRIAWIRHFGTSSASGGLNSSTQPPRVVQFWGTKDSVVTKKDNADLEAFSGPVVVDVPGATHGNLQRLDLAQDPPARWALFSRELFGPIAPVVSPVHEPRRVLFIVRGIRDSSNSDWVRDLRARATQLYGEGNVEDPEYGYFSAAQFAIRPLRAKNIPSFRDLYAQRLAENPRTEFDLIAHSNGTYIFGQSVLSTPSMRFKNVALAAPVLPTDFAWNRLFRNKQVEKVRYDAASQDWPVGILCPALRSLGFSDVGPAGLVLFGNPSELASSRVSKVGWYDGGHGAALKVDAEKNIDNRVHLLNFAHGGVDLQAGEKTSQSSGSMEFFSRATPYVVWLGLFAVLVWLLRRYRAGRPITRTMFLSFAASLVVVYVVLDVM